MKSYNIIFPNLLALCCMVLFGCSHVDPFYAKGYYKPAILSRQDWMVEQRLIVLGDTGDPSPSGEPVLIALEKYAKTLPQKTTVLFLGDNIYENGLPDLDSSDRAEADRRLQAQISTLARAGVRGIFIPGNHDWDKGGEHGLKNILNQNLSISEAAKARSIDVSFLPEAGCPGPRVVRLGTAASVIILDTQWLLSGNDTPMTKKLSECEYTSVSAVFNALSEKLKTEKETGRWTLVASHHPIETYGPHGGFFDWVDHIWPLDELDTRFTIPLPILGSLVAIIRELHSPSTQDLSNPTYTRMRIKINEALNLRKPLLYTSGHDHSLQVFKGGMGAEYQVVSGGGSKSKITSVGHTSHTQFSHAHTGFVTIDFLSNHCVHLSIIEPVGTSNSGEVIYSATLACK